MKKFQKLLDIKVKSSLNISFQLFILKCVCRSRHGKMGLNNYKTDHVFY